MIAKRGTTPLPPDTAFDLRRRERHKSSRSLRNMGAEMGWFLTELFTWWNGQTMGTRFYTWRKGEKVGTDEFGNTYYRAPDKSQTAGGFAERRWVIYSGYAEASKIPTGWHGWMHHRTDTPPSQQNYKPREWQKPHRQNPTGTPNAYRPKGSIVGADHRPRVTGDYNAWTP